MPTFADGVLVHATSLTSLVTGINSINSLLTGAVAPRAYIPTATASLNTAHSINNATDTIVTFDTAGINNDSMWATGGAPFTIQTAGNYLAWAQPGFDAAAGGIRAAYILLNGTSVGSNAVAGGFRNPLNFGGGNHFLIVTPPLALTTGSTLYFSVYQNSGSALNLDIINSGTFMGVLRLGN